MYVGYGDLVSNAAGISMSTSALSMLLREGPHSQVLALSLSIVPYASVISLRH